MEINRKNLSTNFLLGTHTESRMITETNKSEKIIHLNLQNNLKHLNELVVEILDDVEEIGEDYSHKFGKDFCLSEEVKKYEIRLIKLALSLSGGKQRRAAKLLGLKNTTLNNKIVRYQIFPR